MDMTCCIAAESDDIYLWVNERLVQKIFGFFHSRTGKSEYSRQSLEITVDVPKIWLAIGSFDMLPLTKGIIVISDFDKDRENVENLPVHLLLKDRSQSALFSWGQVAGFLIDPSAETRESFKSGGTFFV